MVVGRYLDIRNYTQVGQNENKSMLPSCSVNFLPDQNTRDIVAQHKLGASNLTTTGLSLSQVERDLRDKFMDRSCSQRILNKVRLRLESEI